ncbi:MAG: AAA family ATPase [Pirellulales bacterium]
MPPHLSEVFATQVAQQAYTIQRYTPGFINSAEFASATYPREWLVRQVLLRHEIGVLGAPKKSMKTSIVVDMALSLGLGSNFLGDFAVPNIVPTALLSGESGPATLQETAMRICAAKGRSLHEAHVYWSFDLPQLSNPIDVDVLIEELQARSVGVAFIDPLYLCLLAGANDRQAQNLYDMGPLLRDISRACLEIGVTPVLVHHTTKGSGSRRKALDLDDLAYSGVAEIARQWILLNRRQAYQPGSGEHRLLMSVGGSAGFSGQWEVDIDERQLLDDFGGRTWQTAVRRAQDGDSTIYMGNSGTSFPAATPRERVQNALRRYPNGATATQVSDDVGMNHSAGRSLLEVLVVEGLAECVSVTRPSGRGSQDHEGYRWIGPDDAGDDQDGAGSHDDLAAQMAELRDW